jgi:CMP-N-acetylneuraminic acid synthetase
MILGIIPARKGSQGVPGKNMIDLGGRPLIDYTLATAEHCQKLNRIILSTNIPDAINYTRKHYSRIEVPFVRPDSLATSSSSMVDVVLHAVDFLKQNENIDVGTIVLLQPTCPFRRVLEINNAINLFQEKNMNSLIGVSRVWHHPSDYVHRDSANPEIFNFVFRDPSWLQRQDFPEILFMTGALYICSTRYLRDTSSFYDHNSYLFQMSEETMIDIDSPFDLQIARGLVAGGDFSIEKLF